MAPKAIPSEHSGYKAVRYAQSLGHTAIGYLRGDTDDEFNRQHYQSYLQAINDLQLQDNNHPLLRLADNFDDACKLTNEFLRHRPRGFQFPTVFIAPSDAIALGAMKAFRDLGYHIPEDISFIGYGNSPEGAIFEPPLTTMTTDSTIIERDSVYDIR